MLGERDAPGVVTGGEARARASRPSHTTLRTWPSHCADRGRHPGTGSNRRRFPRQPLSAAHRGRPAPSPVGRSFRTSLPRSRCSLDSASRGSDRRRRPHTHPTAGSATCRSPCSSASSCTGKRREATSATFFSSMGVVLRRSVAASRIVQLDFVPRHAETFGAARRSGRTDAFAGFDIGDAART